MVQTEMTLVLPNIRATIRPLPGHVLIEADLKQADAQVVAWASSDANLKAMFRSGLDIYTETTSGVWSDPQLPQERQIRKNCVHSVNYGAGYRTLAERYTGTERAAQHFITNWFQHHPGIATWHRRIAWEMQQSHTPTIRNVWGYRRVYACPVPLTQPLAWLGQSTVAIVNKHQLLNLSALDAPITLLMPHHDSVLMMVPESEMPDILAAIRTACLIPIPFPDDPLTIPVEIKWSAESWGAMTEWKP